MAESGAPPAAGWQAELSLDFAARGGRTILAHRRHQGPLLVQRPFYPEGGVCHVYVVHPPGGVVGGDRLSVNVRAQPGAQVLLTTPAAGKFYRAGGERLARQGIELDLRGAQLEWLPQETIFYRDCRVRSHTRLQLDADSRCIAWEVGCYGLPARGEAFDAGWTVQGFEVQRGDRLLLHDRLRIDAGVQTARWGLAGQACLGTMLAYPVTREDLEALRALDQGAAPGGLSLADGLLVARALGSHAEAVRRRFLALWQALRPRLLGRAAVAPRIWAT